MWDIIIQKIWYFGNNINMRQSTTPIFFFLTISLTWIFYLQALFLFPFLLRLLLYHYIYIHNSSIIITFSQCFKHRFDTYVTFSRSQEMFCSLGISITFCFLLTYLNLVFHITFIPCNYYFYIFASKFSQFFNPFFNLINYLIDIISLNFIEWLSIRNIID